ncbi:MAG: amidoligase family protein [Tepidisphaeraceae bacterium]|jgi:sulfur carrier protein ThiS
MGLVSSINRTRLIGSEFEGYIILTGGNDPHAAQQSLADVLTASGIRAIARPYDQSPLPNGVSVAVEYDSSIVPEQRYAGIRWAQIEVKSKPLTIDEWETTVPPTLDLLRYAGMRVNASCGHHIHLAFEEMKSDPSKVRSLYNLYHRYQDTIFHLVSESRRTNTYCQALPNGTKFLHGANSMRELRRRLSGADRHTWLNLTHLFEDSPRIEVRAHHGTLDPAKARAWLHLHMAMVDHAVRRSCQAAPVPIPNSRKSFDALITTIGMKPRSGIYVQVDPVLRASAKMLLRTWKKFNGSHAMYPQRNGKRIDLDEGIGAVQEEAA